MLEDFFQRYYQYVSLPLRISLGAVFVIKGYSQISHGTLGDANFVFSFINLFCGLAILFGFFIRIVSIVLISTLLFFWSFSGYVGLNIARASLDSQLLILAATLTLMFTGSGKLSLENYFGFK